MAHELANSRLHFVRGAQRDSNLATVFQSQPERTETGILIVAIHYSKLPSFFRFFSKIGIDDI